MQAAIAYLRVSTREQGRSGLGLASQRRAAREIEAFGAREGFSVKSCKPIHGRYSKTTLKERQEVRALIRAVRAWLDD